MCQTTLLIGPNLSQCDSPRIRPTPPKSIVRVHEKQIESGEEVCLFIHKASLGMDQRCNTLGFSFLLPPSPRHAPETFFLFFSTRVC